ncbi:MAG: hypothetical protein HY392_00280 [Candidatus Diapherotrites archaeon]|nr:hypothetical protein [Candidatus Diapherotrites archaeon]
MRELLKNWKVLVWLAFIALSLASITFAGIQYGIDFKGGTLFQVHLAEKPTADQLGSITSIIQRRVDSFGLRDSKVTPFGEDFLIVQLAETNPGEISRIETILKTQGKFEAMLDGNVLFSGSEIIQIIRDPSQYGVLQNQNEQGFYNWTLPFTLNQRAGQRFASLTFHKCDLVGFSQGQQNQYDCKATYFFIDRPDNSFFVIPKSVFENDNFLFTQGNAALDIPGGESVEKILSNAGIHFIIVDENGLSEAQLQSISSFAEKTVVFPETLSPAAREQLSALGLKTVEEKISQDVPWTWIASGAKTTISLTPGVTGLDPYVDSVENAPIFSDLVITGSGSTIEDAQTRLEDLTILLETGSLPIPIDEISRETISPFLGKEFLDATILMGIVALLLVMLVLFLRYRVLKLTLPIAATVISEIVIILGFASFFRISMDLASVAGLVAVIGTGVNHQIIIIDELLRGSFQKIQQESLLTRTKRAFTIVVATGATMVATMTPLIFFGFGLGKLVGFAVTTILGVFVGVVITRPAFSEIAKYVVEKEEKNKQ